MFQLQLRPFHPVSMRRPAPLHLVPAADHAEAVASPITRYPFPASRSGIVPAAIPSAFFGALQSSHRAFRVVIPD
jgi:hypothetical protein